MLDAISDHQLPVLEALVEAGVDPGEEPWGGCTALQQTALFGTVPTLKYLLTIPTVRASINYYYHGTHDPTALVRACENDKADMVALLLQAGADPTIPDEYGHSPLAIARDRKHTDCIALLPGEHQRARALHKARSLLDAAHAINTAAAPLLITPIYLKRRVRSAKALPQVAVAEDASGDERVVATIKYALGLEGGGIGAGGGRGADGGDGEGGVHGAGRHAGACEGPHGRVKGLMGRQRQPESEQA
jgi:hypothetical protein